MCLFVVVLLPDTVMVSSLYSFQLGLLTFSTVVNLLFIGFFFFFFFLLPDTVTVSSLYSFELRLLTFSSVVKFAF